MDHVAFPSVCGIRKDVCNVQKQLQCKMKNIAMFA